MSELAFEFAQLLREGIHKIRVREGKTVRIVQDEIGYALGRNGGSAVERWRKGMSWPTTGSHRYDGVLIAAGPGILSGAEMGVASHFDLLPTWLNILGQPVPSELQGRILDEMMES